jgi:peptidoglycan hydrolase-like protein with peptidoglycan-binding domain
MVPFFDVEMASDLLSADAYYDWILKVAKGLRAAFGAWPGMYTSDRVWNEVLKSHAAGQLINCPLWIAKPWPWPTGTPVHLDGAPGYNPTTLPEFDHQWMIYQYAGDATGMPGFTPGATDTNRVNIIKRGATGGTVKWIQARAGGGLVVDGIFGANTETHIKELQAQYALAADGIVGADTFTLLTWLNPAPL